ncbi:20152_t:CDS:1 [Funneliformis geosporum]|nr:20152_t:CDS:1 [Funneliformis geosporum]
MTRGHSLKQDLSLLINNSKYSDIEILCKDKTMLHGCRAILAARSEVFNALLYNGMRESYESRISFPKLDSYGMEIVLEYIYTGTIKEDSLTQDNIVEAFEAADYFQLPNLQDLIVKNVKITFEVNQQNNYSPELLTKIVDAMPLTKDNDLLNLLIKAVANIPLNMIEFGRLSITALKYLLSCTHEKEVPFETPEYEVFRYSAILAANQVSIYATQTLLRRLPILEHIDNSIQVENQLLVDRQKVVRELRPLIRYIDFERIKGQILVDIIEPLNIIPAERILNVYRHLARLCNTKLNEFRGVAIAFPESFVWDESACGSNLLIVDNGKVVQTQNSYNSSLQNVRAKVALENKGIFEWDVIIEKYCGFSWVGVCASRDFDYESFAGDQNTAWVLGSSGSACHSKKWLSYCPSFKGDNHIVTVHLDMNKRNCSFTINGTKYPVVSEWNNLPSKLYPVVSLCYPGQFRIQPHQKFNCKYNKI